ncbi:hypothetical protein CHLRE_03g192000v5 [Chlamydomonas reinhardtii]|uniref:Uncharacterized protein n=1 Tax=Chlamydomonas reinhardtii TaxID=3055 RepID=A8IWD6_CHLRE|nr:uncharacterized protein CHLRE_03g192000v5 [Chlamydomonas reinhardtii]PNW85552.1 hypothetical protein CHLRE_03g192000v5 [Chlamydomonas reinhardtii]|eukprot:XP_001693095.1 COP-II coat subunit, nucleoporin [Chlamydomonas reinhardtii]
MATVKETTVVLEELAGPAVDVAYDVSGRRMATCAATPSGSTVIQVHEAGPGPDAWTQVAAWETDLSVTGLAWAHPEYGRVLAGATTSGSVLVWGQVPELQPGAAASVSDEGPGGGYYQPLADLLCGTGPCRSLCFAPRQAGLVLAALMEDGHVWVHEAEDVLAPRVWSLHSKVKAGPSGVCQGLSWRPFSAGVPPMLCAGAGPQALVWQYVLALNSWQVVARLDSGNGQDVASVHWAPPLGRAVELLAVGAGRDMLIFSLSGDTAALQVEQLAALEHDAPVWKVEWDLWGNQVAAATEARQVAVYRPNLVGSWVRQVLVAGQEVEDQEEDDGEEGGSD